MKRFVKTENNIIVDLFFEHQVDKFDGAEDVDTAYENAISWLEL